VTKLIVKQDVDPQLKIIAVNICESGFGCKGYCPLLNPQYFSARIWHKHVTENP
jgi:hypothetical protein